MPRSYRPLRMTARDRELQTQGVDRRAAGSPNPGMGHCLGHGGTPRAWVAACKLHCDVRLDGGRWEERWAKARWGQPSTGKTAIRPDMHGIKSLRRAYPGEYSGHNTRGTQYNMATPSIRGTQQPPSQEHAWDTWRHPVPRLTCTACRPNARFTGAGRRRAASPCAPAPPRPAPAGGLGGLG